MAVTLVEPFDYRLALTDVAPFLRQLGSLICLDSALPDPERGRYSYAMARPSFLLTADASGTLVHRPGDTRRARHFTDDPLDICRAVLSLFSETVALPDLPPFQGGWAGFAGYDYGAALHGIPTPAAVDRASEIPAFMMGWFDWVLAWDHERELAWTLVQEARPVFASTPNEPPRDSAAQHFRVAPVRTEATLRTVRSLLAQCARGSEAPADSVEIDAAPRAIEGESVGSWQDSVRSNFSRDSYMQAVDAVRELILAGDIFQANISQAFTAPQRDDPWELYVQLRGATPAPFAAFIEHDGFAILSASPEMFLTVRGGTVETSPIKGTRPATGNAAHDAALGAELLSSEKDRAENLMIVDLLRNDLSRVCEPGSIRVTRLFHLERWKTVQHLVSTVQGKLRAGMSIIDAFRAAFPGGSITGAPRIRAMQIIAEVERAPRGVYCGSIGYISQDGDAKFNIAIRTATVSRGIVRFSAGGGIIADSDPAAEYGETLVKGEGIRAALSALAPPGGAA